MADRRTPARKLYGVVNWSAPNDTLLVRDDGIRNAMFDFVVQDRPSCFANHEPFHRDEFTGVHCSLFGYLNNIEDLRVRFGLPGASGAALAGHAYHSDRLPELDGVFILVVIDEPGGVCTVSLAASGSSLPLYYSGDAARFVFATSLKDLLVHRGGTRELDDRAARDFLHYGYMIPNEKTLIRGVNKLVPGKQILVDLNRRRFDIVESTSAPVMKRSTGRHAKERLITSITDCADCASRQLIADSRRLTLTAGWDCNLLLYALRNSFAGPITAMTLGVGDSFDETKRAKAIVEEAYRNTSHLAIAVPPDCVKALPDIVWQTEGYLFEAGMFLRHHLARHLPGDRPEAVFLGVGADQILFSETGLKQLLRAAKNTTNTLWRLRRSVRPAGPNRGYQILVDWNLKMHELFLNGCGAMGLYPFVNRETIALSRQLGIWLNWRKRYYRQLLSEVLGPSVTRHIAPKGPVLDTLAIFRASRSTILATLDPELLRVWLTPAQTSRLLGDPDTYHPIILHLAYLCVFQQLFVDESFDLRQDERYIDLTLSEFAVR